MGRINIIPVNSTHATAMFPILQDSSLYQFTGGEPPKSMTDVEQWFCALENRLSPDGSERWLTWIVQLMDSSTSIGYVQATVKTGKADLAWLIGVDWQGQGYATEAIGLVVDWLHDNQVDRLTAHIHRNHKASQRIARSVGLRRSGFFHEGEEIWCTHLEC